MLLFALGAIAATLTWAQLGALFKPDVPALGVEELMQGMNRRGIPERSSTDGKALLLVDVREERETTVSMIPGAITRAEYEASPDDYADRRIVPYCTVGYRSAKYTEKLQERGVDAVNFDGSIIAWVEAGLPLVTPGGEATVRVHTWSSSIEVPSGYVQVVD